MDWTRVKDWLIGAGGMLLVLGIVVGILWWAGSEPARGGEAVPPSNTSAGRLAVDVTAPFDVVAAELGGGTKVSAVDGGPARIVRTVKALGRELRVTATGTVHRENGRLIVGPRTIDVGGPAFLSEGTDVRLSP